jgi:hypothetical protein
MAPTCPRIDSSLADWAAVRRLAHRERASGIALARDDRSTAYQTIRCCRSSTGWCASRALYRYFAVESAFYPKQLTTRPCR